MASLRRFDLAPPRRFLFPAVLMLLAEEPGYGYRLVKELEALRFGAIDRPSVYRTLAQLERDGLAVSSSDDVESAQARRVYRLTAEGERTLRVWMGVIKEERDRLDEVLRRYAGSGFEGALAGVEGEWGAVHGAPLSPVSPTTAQPARRRQARPRPTGSSTPASARRPCRTRFELVPERSAVLVEARSTVGPLSFGVLGLTGTVDTYLAGGRLLADDRTTASVVIPADGLRSGNPIYDAELMRRIDAKRFPVVELGLHGCRPGGEPGRYRVGSDVTIHGVTRRLEGTVVVGEPDCGVLTVTGEQVVDIRDFDISSPAVLMLRIYPDVVVKLYVEAEEVADGLFEKVDAGG